MHPLLAALIPPVVSAIFRRFPVEEGEAYSVGSASMIKVSSKDSFVCHHAELVRPLSEASLPDDVKRVAHKAIVVYAIAGRVYVSDELYQYLRWSRPTTAESETNESSPYNV